MLELPNVRSIFTVFNFRVLDRETLIFRTRKSEDLSQVKMDTFLSSLNNLHCEMHSIIHDRPFRCYENILQQLHGSVYYLSWLFYVMP